MGNAFQSETQEIFLLCKMLFNVIRVHVIRYYKMNVFKLLATYNKIRQVLVDIIIFFYLYFNAFF